jgi:surface antigen
MLSTNPNEPSPDNTINTVQDNNKKSTSDYIFAGWKGLKVSFVAYLKHRRNKGDGEKRESIFKQFNFASFLPHLAIILLLSISLISNYENVKAQAESNQFVSLSISSENNIIGTVNAYTSGMIPVGAIIDIQSTSVNATDGFIATSAPVETQITTRLDPALDNSNKAITYTVHPGDTLSGLAAAFRVNLSTLKYLNDLTDANALKNGKTLKIPKQGYAVDPSLIAKKEADANKQALAKRQAIAKQTLAATTAKKLTKPAYNGYPYGWCTYYVASRRQVPSNWGNAGQWLRSARGAGWSTGNEPVVGAIMVTGESAWGHVTIVESVGGGQVVISEMNGPAGFGVVGRRAYDIGSRTIKGYIY